MAKKVETVEPKKKFPKVLFIILAVIGGLAVLGFILSFAGSMYIGSKIPKNVDVTKTDGGNTVTLGSGDEKITVSDTQKWSDTIPSSVPRLNASLITASAQFGETWTVTAENVSMNDYNIYVASLKSAGYMMDDSLAMTGLSSAAGTKDGYRVGVTYVEDESGNNMMISIAKETSAE